MNIWESDFLQQPLPRKTVPEGSDDFQRALEDILVNGDLDYPCGNTSALNSHCDSKLSPNKKYECKDNDDDYQIFEGQAEDTCLINQKLSKGASSNNDNNNNISELSKDQTATDYCRSHCLLGNIKKDSSTSFKQATYKSSNVLLLSQADDLTTTMGGSCSSNINENGDVHAVKRGSSVDSNKLKKRGIFPKRRSLTERKSESKIVPSNSCKSNHHHHQENNSTDKNEMSTKLLLQTNGIISVSSNGDSILQEDVFETEDTQTVSNKAASPETESPTHVILSSVSDSKTEEKNTEDNVFNDTLHTTKSPLPNGKAVTLETKSPDVSYYEERPRSQSWSNGKLGSRINFRARSSTLRASFTSPSRNNSNGNYSLSSSLRGPKSSPASHTSHKYTIKTTTGQVNGQSFPANMKQEEQANAPANKTRVMQQYDVDPDLAPVSRRRAASESQTMRARKVLPRAPDSAEGIPEQVHVRWADEEKGSSLSTSVFLTSIRPRSYSHGAMDLVPHRPILKKVNGF